MYLLQVSSVWLGVSATKAAVVETEIGIACSQTRAVTFQLTTTEQGQEGAHPSEGSPGEGQEGALRQPSSSSTTDEER